MARAGLSKAVVVSEAIRTADADGIEAVTLARLAANLGVRTPSLYNHVAGFGDLHREIAIRTTRELGDALAEAAVGRSGDDAMRALATAYRQFATTHPGTYATSMAAPQPDDEEHLAVAERAVEVILTVLGGYGLTGDDAIHATRSIRSALHGFSSLELGGGFGIDLDINESHARLIELVIGGISHPRR